MLFIMIPPIIADCVLVLLGVIFNWREEQVYFVDANLTPNWNTVFTGFNICSKIMFYTLLAATGGKLLIGAAMLRQMKKKLNEPYKEIRNKTIAVTLVTWVVVTINSLINLREEYDFSIYWIYIVLKLDDPYHQLYRKFTFALIVLISEVLWMVYNAETINYKYYIWNLMYGRGELNMTPQSSIFLSYIPRKGLVNSKHKFYIFKN